MKINIKLEKNIIVKTGFIIMGILTISLVVYSAIIVKEIVQIKNEIISERVELEKNIYQDYL